jgi:serine/threonine-protein kinase
MDEELKRRAEARIGTVLCGKYRIDQVLGIGGMAVVYGATHRNQKRVAIKMLHPELSLNSDVRGRFMREGYAANTVDHPGAVAVLDDDTADDGSAFLVMERLEGDEVENLARKHGGRLDARVVLAIAEPLLAVLQAAHSKSIVHRDIKPENLYVTRDGTLKVLDFGIARARDAMTDGKGTKTGMLMGTPAYMAPEQAIGKSSDIDGTTDVWAVGATLFTLLAGQQVHEGETSTALLVRTATTPPRSLAVAAPDVDGRVVAIVDRALAFDKAARWPGAAAMRTAVRDAYLAMYGVNVSREPLEQLVGEATGGGATMLASSVPPSVFTPAPTSSGVTRPPETAPPTFPSPVTMGGDPAYPPAQPVLGAAPFAGPPAFTGAGAATPPEKKGSLLVPAIVVGVAIVAGAGVLGVLLSRKPEVATSDKADGPSAEPSAPMPAGNPPPADAADAAASRDADAAPASSPAVGATASPAPAPQVVARKVLTTAPPPAASTAVATAAPAATTATAAPAPTPTPAAPAPAPTPATPPPICRAQCTDIARACKSQCKAQYHIGHDRHQCLVSCETTEKTCKAHAGC